MRNPMTDAWCTSNDRHRNPDGTPRLLRWSRLPVITSNFRAKAMEDINHGGAAGAAEWFGPQMFFLGHHTPWKGQGQWLAHSD